MGNQIWKLLQVKLTGIIKQVEISLILFTQHIFIAWLFGAIPYAKMSVLKLHSLVMKSEVKKGTNVKEELLCLS